MRAADGGTRVREYRTSEASITTTTVPSTIERPLKGVQARSAGTSLSRASATAHRPSPRSSTSPRIDARSGSSTSPTRGEAQSPLRRPGVCRTQRRCAPASRSPSAVTPPCVCCSPTARSLMQFNQLGSRVEVRRCDDRTLCSTGPVMQAPARNDDLRRSMCRCLVHILLARRWGVPSKQ